MDPRFSASVFIPAQVERISMSFLTGCHFHHGQIATLLYAPQDIPSMGWQESVLQDELVEFPVVGGALLNEFRKVTLESALLLDDVVLGNKGSLSITSDIIINIVVGFAGDLVRAPTDAQKLVQPKQPATTKDDAVDIRATIFLDGEWRYMVVAPVWNKFLVESMADKAMDVFSAD